MSEGRNVSQEAATSASTGLVDRLRARVDLPAYAIALVAFALYTAFSVYQWKHFASPSWDLGIFTELAQRYAGIQTPIVDIKGPDFNLLGDHFHPLLVLLGPVYYFFPSGLTLLVLQDALFAVSVVPLVRFARRRIGSWQGIVLGVAFVLSFGIAEAVKAQFHEIAFAVPLMAYGLVAWLEGRRRTGAVLIGLLVFVKEDLGLTVMMLGLVELWIAWGEQAYSAATGGSGDEGAEERIEAGSFPRRTLETLVVALRSKAASLPISLVLWGVLWFVLAIVVLLPALNPSGSWDYTGNIGSDAQSTGSGLLAMLTNLFGPGQKGVIVLLLVTTAGIVGLRSPYMWLMVPTLAWRFAGNVNTYWDWTWHYNAILIPVAMVALVDGVERLRAWEQLRQSWRRNVAWLAVGVSVATSLGMMWGGPLGVYLRGQGTAYEIPEEEISAAQGAIEAVGKSRNVVSDVQMLAYLVPDNRVFWEGSVDDGPVDTVLATPNSQVMNDGIAPEEWAMNRFDGTWETVYDVDGYTVVKRVS